MGLLIARVRVLLAGAFAAACAAQLAFAQGPGAAEGHTYRCTGADGRKYYGQTLPQECIGRAVEMLNKRGLVVKRIDPQADDKTRAARKVEAAKKAEESAAAKEQQRRNRALLATYPTENDVEIARARALDDHAKSVKQIEARIADIKNRQARNAKELEFYTGKNKPPVKLEQDIRNAELDLRAQEGLLVAKHKEVAAINAKYDEDKLRLRELQGGK